MFLIADAYAQGASGASDFGMSVLPFVAIFVVFYFLMIRPQMKRQKEHKAMVDALGKGDEVLTSGGMVGKISEIGDQYVTLQVSAVADKAVEITIQRGSIQTLLPKGTMKSGLVKGGGNAGGGKAGDAGTAAKGS